MDEARIDQLGIGPLRPQLARIDALQDGAAVQREIQYFHTIGIAVPFNVYGESDDRNPNDVIVQVSASGLGMPDRDYYVKTEARFEEARAKYLEHAGPTCSPDATSTCVTTGRPSASRWIAAAGAITTPTSDAYYNPLLNEIVFPAGILQPPAFNLAAATP